MSDYASEGGHWYDKDGTPKYTIIGANGKVRNTTLRDAKKRGWLPSVSGVMDCLDRAQLNQWINKQYVYLCHATPCLPNEDKEKYLARIVTLYREEGVARRAKDTGTLIHGYIEKSLKKEYDWDQAYAQHVNTATACLSQWCNGLADLRAEKSFAHPLGYGGKCDAHKWGFVADFKSKDFDEGWKPVTYPNHWMQLRAYADGLEMPDARCAIIYVSTKVPGLVRLVEIDRDDLDHGWELFQAALKVWQIKNRYIPEPRKELKCCPATSIPEPELPSRQPILETTTGNLQSRE
jgi:hypothetical protein